MFKPISEIDRTGNTTTNDMSVSHPKTNNGGKAFEFQGSNS